MKLPILMSVPHAGTRTPDEVASLVRISPADVIADGDEQAADIYLPLRGHVAHVVTTDIARVFVDVNRAADDFRKDGVVKTHSCWDVPVYTRQPDEALVSTLLAAYYNPYHERLRDLGREVRVGIDCHTMAAVAPPVAPDPGQTRPAACVSDADGSCERGWTEALAMRLREALGGEVRINDPFKGGYITRSHAAERPWLQLEISRGDFASAEEKSAAVRTALTAWAGEVFTR
jgi:N-formylglutamate deformylase